MDKRNIYESEIEEWLEMYPEELFGAGKPSVLGRQVRLPHGIADLLLWEDRVIVVELKAGALKKQHVCQVLRYTYDVRMWIGQIAGAVCCVDRLYEKARSLYTDGALGAFTNVLTKYFLFHIPDDGLPPVMPVLVGEACPDDIYVAMQAAGGEVFEWTETDEGYSFRRYAPYGDIRRLITEMRAQPRPAWLKTTVSHILQLACDEANACLTEDILSSLAAEGE